MKKCAVIGSINMDMVTRVDHFPRPGETRTGYSFQTAFGGKGANQAVALGRLSADVVMLGKVGQDAFGDQYLANFEGNGVSTALIARDHALGTGVAAIEVDDTGENHIIVVPGANAAVDAAFLKQSLTGAMDADIFLLQLETPMEGVVYAAQALKAAGKTVMLDPAPAAPIPDELLANLDYITPNEHELIAITPDACATREERIQWLLNKGVQCVLNKLGTDGAVIVRAGESGMKHVPSFSVRARDTTAAGDTFNAAFAFSLTQGLDDLSALRYACAAAAISVTAPGAQGGMPTHAQVLDFLRAHDQNTEG